MKDKVIRPKKPKGVSKSPWEHKIRKRAKESQGKQMGQRCLRENKWDTGAASNVIKSPMTILSLWEKNKQQAQWSLAGLGQMTSQQEWQNSEAGNGSKTARRNKRVS